MIECLKDLGDLVVFAPDGPRSGMGSAITSLVPIKYTLLKKEEGLTIYSCTGTPVDCVKLAINEVMERKPDLLVSGINHGGNMAICVNYSGTMGATAEGCIFNVPSMVYPYWTMRPMPTSPNAAVLDVCWHAGIKRRLTARNLLKPQRAEATASERVESLSPSGWSLGT